MKLVDVIKFVARRSLLLVETCGLVLKSSMATLILKYSSIFSKSGQLLGLKKIMSFFRLRNFRVQEPVGEVPDGGRLLGSRVSSQPRRHRNPELSPPILLDREEEAGKVRVRDPRRDRDKFWVEICFGNRRKVSARNEKNFGRFFVQLDRTGAKSVRSSGQGSWEGEPLKPFPVLLVPMLHFSIIDFFAHSVNIKLALRQAAQVSLHFCRKVENQLCCTSTRNLFKDAPLID